MDKLKEFKLSYNLQQNIPDKQPGIISVALSKQIASPIQMEIDFDATLDEFAIQGSKTVRDIELRHKNSHKPIFLTNKQVKAVFALSYILTSDRNNNEDIRKGSISYNPVIKEISIKELSKIINTECGTREREIIETNNIVKDIADVWQFVMYDNEMKFRPLISILGGKTTYVKDKKIKDITLQIMFNPLFTFNSERQFAMIKKSIFEKWDGTDLFANIINQLLQIWSLRNKQSKELVKEIRKTNSGKSEDEVQKKIAEAQLSCFTYKENAETIISRCNTNYSDRRSKKRLISDLESCNERLKSIGIVLKSEIKIGSKGQLLQCTWILNKDYTKSQAILETSL